MGLALDKALGE